MTAVRNFYLSPEAWRTPFQLEGPEAHHLARVLRIRPGEVVRLFDGLGRHGLFRVETVSKGRAALAPQSEASEDPPAVRCTLAAGFSRALRRSWFMEKSVELEAAALWFWQGEYSQAALPEAEKDSWRSSLIAGAKQCGSSWLPELSMLRGGVSALIERGSAFDRTFFLYEGETDGRLLQQADLADPGDILLIVGPEGGFSPREAALLREAGITPASLGGRILRWETAAILALGLAWWARQRA